MTLADLERPLLAARNLDGGWGYYPGKGSRLEPTCWALLALRADGDDLLLRQWPERGGLLLERPGGEPNYAFHGLALLWLRARGAEHESGNATLLTGIQRVKGIALELSPDHRQDNRIQAWSWFADTFSWVEPTACCLLALKKWAPADEGAVDAQRVADAEAMLFDRCCIDGGWNYGNSNMLGQELSPYVPTTALALLALQDRTEHPAVQRSLAWLERQAVSERSAVALSLALIALRALRRPTDRVESALAAQLPTTLAMNSLLGQAMALFAMNMNPEEGAFVL